MEEASHSGGAETEGHGHGVLWWVWITGLILLFYVLSVGPACKAKDAGLVTVGALAVVYAPLVWASGFSPPVNSVLVWYVKTVWKAK